MKIANPNRIEPNNEASTGRFSSEGLEYLDKGFKEEIYELLTQAFVDVIFLTDLDGTIRFIGTIHQNVFGFTFKQMFAHKNLFRFLDIDSSRIEEFRSGNTIRNLKCELLDANDQHRYLLVDSLKTAAEEEKLLFSCKDITDLEIDEEAHSRLASIVESSYDAIIGMETDGTIVSWNSGAKDIYGYDESEVLGQPIQMLIPPEKSDEVSDILDNIRNCQRLEQYTTIRMRKDDSRFDASVTLSPIKGKKGEISGVSAIIRDISPQKHAERKLRDAYEKLDTERTVLKEIMSHIEEDKKQIEKQIQENYNKIILPLIQSIKEKSGQDYMPLISLLEKGLENITSPFINKLDSNFAKLSPRELNICNMIKNGMSSKEIAEILHISLLTVHKFRQQIRKKLGLNKKSINLCSFLNTV
ncbi:MAG: PAS domain S-box protein [candidate division Zixibacteria bacterium]|nr:PAS domain S-box protein [candidate division Zixibacteria bacterium]